MGDPADPFFVSPFGFCTSLVLNEISGILKIELSLSSIFLSALSSQDKRCPEKRMIISYFPDVIPCHSKGS